MDKYPNKSEKCTKLLEELASACACIDIGDIINSVKYGLQHTGMDANAREVAYQDILAALNRRGIISNTLYEMKIKEGVSR